MSIKKIIKHVVFAPFRLYYTMNLFGIQDKWNKLSYNYDKDGLLVRIKKAVVREHYYLLDDESKMEFNKRYVWGSTGYGNKWHNDKMLDSCIEIMKERRMPLLCKITDILMNRGGQNYAILLETGCGNGTMLKFCKDIFKNKFKYIGIDISQETINCTEDRFKDDNDLLFLCKDLFEYINDNEINNTIFLFCGTLEYFTQNDIEKFLQLLKNKANNVAIALFEPVEIDFDNVFESKPRGGFAYSHNYAYLLNKNGFKVEHLKHYPININIPFYDDIECIATYRLE